LSAISIRRQSEPTTTAGEPSRLRGWALAGAMAVVLGACALWGTHSPAFRLRSVSVTGQRHLTAGEVEHLAGLSARTNVFWISPGDLARRLERNPWVASALVSRSLPSTLRITIRERTPVAILPGRQRQAVAADGVVLEPASLSAVATLPLIVVAGRAVGPQSAGAKVRTRLALEAAGALTPGILHQVSTVSVATGPASTVVLKLRNGTLVRFGDDAQAGEKARVLRAVLTWVRHHSVRAAVIDIESPASPSILRATSNSGA
jgi:cell division protein FtsQ